MDIIKSVLKISGFKTLNPVQKEAVEKGLLKRKNLIISTPTASGKTLIAEIAGLYTFNNKLGKTIYICPLVALASEKHSSFKKKYSKLGIKVALSVGDLDSSDPHLTDYDWIVVSNEKIDSLIRHDAHWIKDIGLIVADEIHLLNDPSRGPTLEILLTRLKRIVPRAQILGLSATVKNVRELAEWLNAEIVVSEWRPVKLYEGISYDSKIKFFEKDGYKLNENLPLELAIIDNTLNLRKQALFFVASRRNAESLAERLGMITTKFLTRNEKQLLQKISDEILNVLEIPTKQCKRLAKCIKRGAAFHHAGLVGKQKKIIENKFREGIIKVICATPTLAMGVNLPAFRVVIRDAKRYYAGYGARYIPILEYKQMSGRGGRPTFDSWGESILLAKSEDEADELAERYVMGEPEEIYSKLALEPVLRMHVLALIASEIVKTEKSLLQFFSNTFYAYQYHDISSLNDRILSMLDELVELGFVIMHNGKLKPTRIGKRVSELYIDPITAYNFIKALDRAKTQQSEFGYLHLISNTLEMKPLLSIRTGEFSEISSIITTKEHEFLQEIPDEWDLDYDDFLKSVKTALMLDTWINEMTEDDILTNYHVTPGELRVRLKNAEWLLYALHELALLLRKRNLLKQIRKTRIRIMYGVKEELIPLVKLKNIGRVRARKLYNSGLKTIKSLRIVPLETLSHIIGVKIALKIKEQLGEKVEKIREEKQSTLMKLT